MTKIRVYQKNILNQYYCTKESYPETDLKWLNDRKEAILQEIFEQVQLGSLIFLQEVWQDIIPDILDLLSQNEYSTHWDIYHKTSMGILISVPKKIKISQVNYYKTKNSLVRFLYKFTSNPEVYKSFINSNNTMMVIYAEYENTRMILANYHCPCKFQNVPLMKMFVNWTIYNLLGEKNVIFCSDLNTKPNEPRFKLYSKYGFKSSENLNVPTTKSKTFKNPVFNERIDYCLFKGFKLIHETIPEITDEHIPSKNETSDHVSIISIFEV